MSDKPDLSRRQLLRGSLFGKRAAEAPPKPHDARADEEALPLAKRPAPHQPKIAGPADATPPPGATANPADDPRLPELTQSVLDADSLACLFRDIAACTQVLEVIPRYGRQQLVEDKTVTLSRGQQLLMDGEARALQVRYRYDGAEWWDTLIRETRGVKIVRIRHDFDS